MISRIPRIYKTHKKFIIKTTLLFLACAGVITASFFRILDPYENILLDFRFRLRPQQKVSDEIAIIEISEDTLQQLGYWPIPRDFHASLVDVLSASGVKQIMFDVIFVDPTQHDNVFRDSINRAGNVYLPFVLGFSQDSVNKKNPNAISLIAPLLPDLKTVAKGTGHINVFKDVDGKGRWIPLFTYYKGKRYPHIALRMACDYLNIPIDGLMKRENKIFYERSLNIPTSKRGSLLVNYAGPWVKTFRHYSYVDVIKAFQERALGRTPRVNLDELKDSICLIGLTATGTSDLHSIPLENNYPMVGLHANIINSILLNQHIYRLGEIANIALLCVLLSIVLWIAAIRKDKPLIGLYCTMACILGFILLGFILFIFFGIWVDIFCPIVVVFILYSGLRIYHFMEKNRKQALIDKELSIAKSIQESFLPEPIKKFSGLSISAKMQAAKHVGGDLYDTCRIGKEKLGVFLGDVSGKGVPASLIMAKTISLFRVIAEHTDKPGDLLFQLNEMMLKDAQRGVFVTAVYVVYIAEKRKMMIASAGHLPVLVVRKKEGRVESVNPKEGMPLGLVRGIEFSQEEICLNEGDKVILYTDGIVEAKNIRRQDYGEERFIDLLKSTIEMNVDETIEAIEKEVCAFAGKAPKHDDCTLIVLQENGI